jgi:hypothetical protein
MTNLGSVVQALRNEHARLSKQIQGVTAALAAFGSIYKESGSTKRNMTAAGRARIAAAQRARWAKIKGNGGARSSSPIPKKRTISAAGRKRIAAAQRARWAKAKAAKKA